MFSRRRWTGIAALVALAAGCGGPTNGSSTPAQSEYLGAITLAHSTQLPPCNAGQKGSVYYVTSADELSYCDGKKYREIDLSGRDGKDGQTWLVQVTVATGAQCPAGGAVIQVGPDANRDGLLDQVKTSTVVCNGARGPAGRDGLDGAVGPQGPAGPAGGQGETGVGVGSLVVLTAEPAGPNCESGGQRIDVGQDSDSDAILDPSEVTQTSYVCNGNAAAGSGGFSGGGTSNSGGSGNSGGSIAGSAGDGADDSGALLAVVTGLDRSLGAYRDSSGHWSVETIFDDPADGAAVATTDPLHGLALVRDLATHELLHSRWTGAWFTSAQAIASGLMARGPAAITPSANGVAVAYQGVDFKYYLALSSGGGWSPLDERIEGWLGAAPPAVTGLRTRPDLTAAFSNNQGRLLTSMRWTLFGTWLGFVHGTEQTGSTQPAIVTLRDGRQLLVYALANGNLSWTVGGRGVWSTPTEVPDASSSDRVALAATRTGAVLVFRGEDSLLYWSRLQAVGWSRPASVRSLRSPTSAALTTGVGTHEAELLYVDATDNTARHLSLALDGTWGTTTTIGSSATSVAIAAFPQDWEASL